jgi:hypothetical protein
MLIRRLLVGSAHYYILGPFAEDSELRRHGLKIALGEQQPRMLENAPWWP